MKKPVIALLAALALVALAALVAGCGSSSSSTESTASLSKAEFIKEADSICETTEKQDNKEINALLKEEGIPKGKEPSKEVLEEATTEIALPGISSQLEEIRALGFPEGKDGEEAEAVLESAEATVEEVEEEPTSLFTGTAFKQTNKEAQAYGFKVCGAEG